MHNSRLSAGTSRPAGRRLFQAFLMLFAVVAGALTFSGTAQAHGSVVGPPPVRTTAGRSGAATT